MSSLGDDSYSRRKRHWATRKEIWVCFVFNFYSTAWIRLPSFANCSTGDCFICEGRFMRVTVLQGNGRSTKLEDRVNIIFQPESTKTSSVQGGEWRKKCTRGSGQNAFRTTKTLPASLSPSSTGSIKLRNGFSASKGHFQCDSECRELWWRRATWTFADCLRIATGNWRI